MCYVSKYGILAGEFSYEGGKTDTKKTREQKSAIVKAGNRQLI